MDAHERRALPEGWKILCAENVSERVTDGTHDTPKPVQSGYYLITSRHIKEGKLDFSDAYLISEVDFIDVNKRSKVDVGDVLFSMIGTVGLTAVVKKEYPPFAIKNVGLFKANNNLILPFWLLYYFRSTLAQKYVHNNLKGTTQKYIPLYALKRFPILLPPLPTQRRIVSILEKAEETTRLRAQADELTNRLLQSVFLEMFGDPVRNPKRWEKYEFKDIIQEFRYGTSIKSSEGGYPVLRIPNVINGKINLNELKYCKVTINEYEKIRLQQGDVLFVRTNGNQDYVGRCAIVEKIQQDFIFASYLIRAKLKLEIISPYYLKNYLFTRHGKNLIKSKTKTTAGQFNINTQGLGSLEILVPPLPLQQKFARIIEKIESMRQSQNQSKQQIEDLFSALMQKAFRGEI